MSVEDIQTVAQDVLERDLTEKELALVEESVGDYIDWFGAIESAINKHITREIAKKV
jgi:hypothetical protein